MRSLVSGCSSLLSLSDISKWNTSEVKDLSYMFNDCKALSSLPDISKWSISIFVDKTEMFSGCDKTLDIPAKFRENNYFNFNFKQLNYLVN